MFLYEWLGDGLNGLAEDLCTAAENPALMPLYMASLRKEITDVFEEYWIEHSGNYEYPELTYHRFIAFIPLEFRMLQLEYADLLYRASKEHGKVTLLRIELLCPDDTIAVTFKATSP